MVSYLASFSMSNLNPKYYQDQRVRITYSLEPEGYLPSINTNRRGCCLIAGQPWGLVVADVGS